MYFLTTRSDARLLTQLTYTVFDTQTTGLDPSADEIIQIGATHIVNGCLAEQGIYTLRNAREAAERTFYAKVKKY